MIQEIHIRDLGVIREARLALAPGLNVITGETGAGKTMVLSALGLLLGQRADASLVRNGQQQTQVVGRLSVSQQDLLERIAELGGVIEDSELIMNRTVSSEGKSRASIGGSAVPVAALAEISEQLVVVHGQADQLRLKSPTAQREALDSFAGNAGLLHDFQQAYREFLSTQKSLAEIRENSSARALEIQQLQIAIDEIEKVNPKPSEDTQLAELAHRLGNVEALRASAAGAHEAISSEGDEIDALGLVGQAKKALEQSGDSKLIDLASTLSEAAITLRETAGELASYLSGLDIDSEYSLDQIQQRRSDLGGLIRKYAPTIDEVLAFQVDAKKKLSELDVSDEQIQLLERKSQEQYQRATQLARQLSDSRKSAARDLAEQVSQELTGLAMKDSKLVVEVTELSDMSAHGIDQVAFLLTSYSGANPRPVAKAASGGEMSRIMLALEVTLARTAQNSTFIFDEVDAGVGGAAAIEVGRRLARLAQQAQVIVVTHLAQVAAFADHQLQVHKSSTESLSETDVTVLDSESRLEELARMLSGLSDSASARQHAAELMSLAKSEQTN